MRLMPVIQTYIHTAQNAKLHFHKNLFKFLAVIQVICVCGHNIFISFASLHWTFFIFLATFFLVSVKNTSLALSFTSNLKQSNVCQFAFAIKQIIAISYKFLNYNIEIGFAHYMQTLTYTAHVCTEC